MATAISKHTTSLSLSRAGGWHTARADPRAGKLFGVPGLDRFPIHAERDRLLLLLSLLRLAGFYAEEGPRCHHAEDGGCRAAAVRGADETREMIERWSIHRGAS
jgi:hypothetical protein